MSRVFSNRKKKLASFLINSCCVGKKTGQVLPMGGFIYFTSKVESFWHVCTCVFKLYALGITCHSILSFKERILPITCFIFFLTLIFAINFVAAFIVSQQLRDSCLVLSKMFNFECCLYNWFTCFYHQQANIQLCNGKHCFALILDERTQFFSVAYENSSHRCTCAGPFWFPLYISTGMLFTFMSLFYITVFMGSLL